MMGGDDQTINVTSYDRNGVEPVTRVLRRPAAAQGRSPTHNLFPSIRKLALPLMPNGENNRDIPFHFVFV